MLNNLSSGSLHTTSETKNMSDELLPQTNPEMHTLSPLKQLDLEIEILGRILTTLSSMEQEILGWEQWSEEHVQMASEYVQQYTSSYQALKDSFVQLRTQVEEDILSDSTDESYTSETTESPL